jgi:hypothetical protein
MNDFGSEKENPLKDISLEMDRPKKVHLAISFPQKYKTPATYVVANSS